MKRFRLFWLLLGMITLVLGTIGIFLPLLPTVPFYLATVFCFARSSDRLHDWFLQTGLYASTVGTYKKRGGMTRGMKARVLLLVSVLFGMAIFFMRKHWIPCGIVAVIWLMHIYVFLFHIKTLKPSDLKREEK
ncbi:YbaN family protein [Murdochiella vaginalis]|uniref:YbaN family protein n=1 Tax=Murdochiella vaginalis TaxID=1852373 RepID=UPI000A4F3475|nr:YbaN family protein [Murdochiella vaginalis]